MTHLKEAEALFANMKLGWKSFMTLDLALNIIQLKTFLTFLNDFAEGAITFIVTALSRKTLIKMSLKSMAIRQMACNIIDFQG